MIVRWLKRLWWGKPCRLCGGQPCQDIHFSASRPVDRETGR
jgi:hypothetical protein